MKTLSRPKEKIYLNILQVRNEIKVLKGEKSIDLDQYTHTLNFASYARHRKLHELETEYEIALEALDAEKKDAARREWLNTEEGKAALEAHNKAITDIRKQSEELREQASNHVRAFVQNLLGTDFDFEYFNERGFSVGLVKEYNANNIPVTYFGHSFQVYYDYVFGKFQYELNYGTMGSFELGVDINRTKFLEALGKFAKSCFDNDLKEYLKAFNVQARRLREEEYKLEREFKDTGSK